MDLARDPFYVLFLSKIAPQKKTPKNHKNRPQTPKIGRKRSSKCSSGAHFFDFLETLFSYNTTVVLLVFTGSGWSRGDQKSIKKRVGKTNLKKQRFLAKSAEKCSN